MSFFKPFAACAMIATLSGCNAIAEAIAAADDEPTASQQFQSDFLTAVDGQNAYGTTGQAAAATIRALQDLPTTSGSDLPTSGSARFAGHVGLGEVSNGVIGEMAVTATFGANSSLDGSVTNFVDTTGAAVAGNLNVSGGTIDTTVNPEDNFQITGVGLEGPLTYRGQNGTYFGTLSGDFLGAGGVGIGGEIYGSHAGQELNGFFGATRN